MPYARRGKDCMVREVACGKNLPISKKSPEQNCHGLCFLDLEFPYVIIWVSGQKFIPTLLSLDSYWKLLKPFSQSLQGFEAHVRSDNDNLISLEQVILLVNHHKTQKHPPANSRETETLTRKGLAAEKDHEKSDNHVIVNKQNQNKHDKISSHSIHSNYFASDDLSVSACTNSSEQIDHIIEEAKSSKKRSKKKGKKKRKQSKTFSNNTKSSRLETVQEDGLCQTSYSDNEVLVDQETCNSYIPSFGKSWDAAKSGSLSPKTSLDKIDSDDSTESYDGVEFSRTIGKSLPQHCTSRVLADKQLNTEESCTIDTTRTVDKSLSHHGDFKDLSGKHFDKEENYIIDIVEVNTSENIDSNCKIHDGWKVPDCHVSDKDLLGDDFVVERFIEINGHNSVESICSSEYELHNFSSEELPRNVPGKFMCENEKSAKSDDAEVYAEVLYKSLPQERDGNGDWISENPAIKSNSEPKQKNNHLFDKGKQSNIDIFLINSDSCSIPNCGENLFLYGSYENKIHKAIEDAYRIQLASELIQQRTGSPLAEFERFICSASPILKHSNRFQSCVACSRDPLSGYFLCKHQTPNISLGKLWQWFEKPGCYGLEVKAEDSLNFKRATSGSSKFQAYFVPSLSAIQLFNHSTSSASDPQISSILKLNSEVEECLNLSFPVNTARVLNAELLFEYFEHEQPQLRRPVFEKIKELVRGDLNLNCQMHGDPLNLEHLNLKDLHPASWYSIAWYPIYRIPEANFRAAFLTYHSFGHFICKSAESIASVVVGMQSYNVQGECWLQPRTVAAAQIDKSPDINPSNVLKERLRTLEQTAFSFSRASVYKGNQISKNKQHDYEFFLSRRR